MGLEADHGTENGIIGALQCTFRHHAEDKFAGVNSFRVVRSKSGIFYCVLCAK